MPNDRVVYWDSCVFIDRIEGANTERVPALRAMTDAAAKNDLKIVTSAFTLAEVVKLKALVSPDYDQKEILIRDFFDNEYIFVRNVDPRVSGLARRIVRDHKIKPPDAVHVATALLTKVDVLHTYDGPLTNFTGRIRYPDITGVPLRIEEPKWEWQQQLITSDATLAVALHSPRKRMVEVD
jgi:predicted nucleic acid-binding protein